MSVADTPGAATTGRWDATVWQKIPAAGARRPRSVKVHHSEPASAASARATEVLAGLARAKEQGVGLGRRRLEDSDSAKVAAIKRALTGKQGVRRIARDLKTGVGTVLRIKSELAA
jgi:hypothetical protein